MKITVDFESKPFKKVYGEKADETIRHKPCKYCALSKRFTCLSRKDCQWDKEEIFIKSNQRPLIPIKAIIGTKTK